MLRGEPLDSLAGELGVTAATLATWREQFPTSPRSRGQSRDPGDITSGEQGTSYFGAFGTMTSALTTAPLSKSSVSRVVATLKAGLDAWQSWALADLDVVYLHLDAIALRVRSAGKVVSMPSWGSSRCWPTARSSS